MPKSSIKHISHKDFHEISQKLKKDWTVLISMNTFTGALSEKLANKNFNNKIMDKNILFFDCQTSIDSVKKYIQFILWFVLEKNYTYSVKIQLFQW
jgi:polysaccharide deacetylase 2 family uncharacterized protein YibQ